MQLSANLMGEGNSMPGKDLICSGPTSRCLRFFMQNIEGFAPVIKVTSFFEEANLLLTDYVAPDNGFHTVIENARGEKMFLSGTNCGYGGEGPNGTRKILEYLGVPTRDAEKCMYHNAFEVLLGDQSIEIHSNTPLFFAPASSANTCASQTPCLLNKYTSAVVYDRVVYMYHPEIYNLKGYYSCLEVMKPFKAEYSLGNHPVQLTMPISLENMDITLLDRQSDPSKNINLVIHGHRFSLICNVSTDGIVPLIYSTYLSAYKVPMADPKIDFTVRFKDDNLFVEGLRDRWHHLTTKRSNRKFGTFSFPDEKRGLKNG